jgi:hypothetical protein
LNLCDHLYLGDTNRQNYEFFAILGEAYGSGLPLGFLLIKGKGTGFGSAKGLLIQECFSHMKKYFGINPLFTHSDKDLTEISACRCCFQHAKHQLCFWHCLRAIKVRLSVIKCTPAPYDPSFAHEEFEWINLQFQPVGQGGVSTAFIFYQSSISNSITEKAVCSSWKDSLTIHLPEWGAPDSNSTNQYQVDYPASPVTSSSSRVIYESGGNSLRGS